MKQEYHKTYYLRAIMLVILLLLLIISSIGFIKGKEFYSNVSYLCSDNKFVTLYSYNKDKLVKKKDVLRGKSVITNGSKKINNRIYEKILYQDKYYFVLSSNVSKNRKDIVKEKYVYVRSSETVLKDTDTSEILGLVKKGDKLEVIDYDYVSEGIVNTYRIKYNDSVGYVYGKYMTFYKEEASLNYDSDKYNQIHSNVKNSYGGGEAIKLDFYPVSKPSFKDNKMPKAVYALYLNNSSEVINNIDKYIAFAKDTKINAFVVDIKDNTSPGYDSEVMKELSITNYNHAVNKKEDYKKAIDKLKDNGFYVIGRITTFKDSYYIEDNPGSAISDKDGNPYLHNRAYWPSAYDRRVWYYNVSLAKEAVREFGFNEINFDYVRFPDRLQRIENEVDMHNDYNEDKVEAIQRFLMYATDEIHKEKAYVSADVFGETTNGTYTTAYGQYWPAISNVVDVISGMPYPDHFSSGCYGITKPWNSPYDLMYNWGLNANLRQQETTTPAVVRTWIQAFDVGKYVDINGIDYNANEVEQEVRGLYDSEVYGGYITWLSNSSLEKYGKQKGAFQIDYLKEYKNEKN